MSCDMQLNFTELEHCDRRATAGKTMSKIHKLVLRSPCVALQYLTLHQGSISNQISRGNHGGTVLTGTDLNSKALAVFFWAY